jgi:hypothetical protein
VNLAVLQHCDLSMYAIRAWSLIRNKKPIILFERHCHATEKSEAIACVRRCWSSQITRWWSQKRIIGKNRGPRSRRGTRDHYPPPQKKKSMYTVLPKLSSGNCLSALFINGKSLLRHKMKFVM